ncbi:hypothetical protein NUACC21_76170 [Scytonema sp. NUACC21]
MSNSTLVKKILILAANPQATTFLRLGEEIRDIQEALRLSRNRDQFVIESRLAVRHRDLQRAMLEVQPQIIHFSGHGSGVAGLVFEDEIGQVKFVDAEGLAGLFKLFIQQVECVVLNACYSEVQAEAIAQYIDVIGMQQAIGDKAAIEFAVGFYGALGAGRSIESAYQFACAAIRLAGLPEHLTPILKKKPEGSEIDAKDSLPYEQPSIVNQSTFALIEQYCKKVEEWVVDGKISDIIRESLEAERQKLGIPVEQALAIEAEVLKPYQEYNKNLEKYLRTFVKEINRESSISEESRHELKILQQNWQLKDEDLEKMYNGLGNVMQKKSLDKAIIIYKEAIKINNNNAVTHKYLGSALFIQGKINDAIFEYREAICIEPDNAELSAELGNIFHSQSLLNEAITEYKKAISLKPENAEFHNDLGLALYSQDNLEEAMTEYRKAIELNSNLAKAYDGLGIVLYRKGNLEEAVTNFETAIKLEPENSVFHKNLSMVLYSQGNLKEAIGKLKNAIHINPNDAISYTHLAFALLKQGKQDDAKSEIEYAINLFKEQGGVNCC